MKMTFVTRKFRNVERNVHCDELHITPDRVARLFLDCNGVFAIKAYNGAGQRRCIPGWNEHVKELHGAARDAYLLWKHSDKHRQGVVDGLMLH